MNLSRNILSHQGVAEFGPRLLHERVLLGATLSNAGFHGGPRLPLALTVGRWLLAQAGHAGGHDIWCTVDADGAPALGRRVAASDERTAMLVLGEGSSANGPHAPLPQDDRAPALDASVTDVLRRGDLSALGALDRDLATSLGVTGWAPWQALASAAGGRAGAGRLLSYGAPYEVGYVVGTWVAR